MMRLGWPRGAATVSALVTSAMMLAAAMPGRASVISDTPTLPLLNVPYVTAAGGDCFPTAGICVSGGTFVLLLPASSTFDAVGQHITSAARYSATLTTLTDVQIGLVELFGTVEQEVVGRTFATETGSWTTNLVSLSLSGPLLGNTLTLTLDPDHESTGITSITPAANDIDYMIDSFFDIFVELSLDGPVPLTTTRGPIRAEAVQAVPEPASITAISIGLAMMLAAYRRRSAAFSAIRSA